ncbi:MAG: prenyltransferase/squalene oxidase repeat-containing protein [Phycisphaerae bacterium]
MQKHNKIHLAALALVPIFSAGADQPGDWKKPTLNAVDRGLKFLASTQQADGGWISRSRTDPAITALAAKCFIQSPDHGPGHPISQKAVAFILKYRQPDGGIYVPDQGLRNYYTSVCTMALAATHQAAHDKTIRRAQQFLKKGQWDEAESIDPKSEWYGGAGYGRHKRPDLSNTQLMLEALQQSGLPEDDPVYQKALVFISRCQMSSESNDRPFARAAADGGFIYTPVGGGESKAGSVTVDGRTQLRSYGSMTYAGFKSLLYAGLSSDDARVKAAFDWIRRHYTLEVNPNMPGRQSHEGLYYYYHAFARALDAWGRDVITDAQGLQHRWRQELCLKLVSLQREDGSWVNASDRWYEGNAYLVTAYAILAIQTAAR